MRGVIAVIVSLASASVGFGQEAEDAVRVMSFNIRYNNPADGPNAWPHRKDWVAEIIRENADIVGMQEVRKEQLDDLRERLPGYEFYGVGRDDGKEAGEFVPLAWRKDRFTTTDKGVFWLSETPDEPGSKGWDAQLPRVTTWVYLRDKKTNEYFLVVNTHFDHKGEKAREESAELLRNWIGVMLHQSYVRSGRRVGDAVILTGDFNTLPDSVPYRTLTGAGTGPRLEDARLAVENPQGPESTWNGFKEIVPGRRIDFVFTFHPAKVIGFRTIDETREGRFPSDHLPIVATVTLPE